VFETFSRSIEEIFNRTDRLLCVMKLPFLKSCTHADAKKLFFEVDRLSKGPTATLVRQKDMPSADLWLQEHVSQLLTSLRSLLEAVSECFGVKGKILHLVTKKVVNIEKWRSELEELRKKFKKLAGNAEFIAVRDKPKRRDGDDDDAGVGGRQASPGASKLCSAPDCSVTKSCFHECL